MQRSDLTTDALLRRALFCMRAEQFADAVYWLRRYLAAPDCVWADARCDAMLALAHCFLQTDDRAEAERWILRALAEAPVFCEPWLEAAAFYEPVSPHAAALCRARAEALP